ncbi:MAG TPA: hydrogenase maturation nickel metallochaperone HypA [Ktedonobacteraceae bacterium]|jgi:hydrogenase nickel incorporation protein HypA/HybF
MHELAIAQSIIDAVGEKAAMCNATRIKSVRLLIGEACGIFIDSLTFSFEMLASFDPMLDGARLLIDEVPHRAHCRHCNGVFAVASFVTQCPACQIWDTEIISGDELQILEMEIETEPSSSPLDDPETVAHEQQSTGGKNIHG